MKTKIILTATILFITLSAIAGPPSEEGKTIFTTRCASCHNVNKILVGPALAGVDQRRPIDWIVNFVHSSQKVVKSGDPYAVELFNKFNKIQMPDHPDLTADNIKNIVEYIKVEAKTAAEKKPETPKEKTQPSILTMILSNNALLVTFSALILMLLTALTLLIKVKQIQRSKNLK